MRDWGIIDRPSIVRTKIARETQHEVLLVALCGCFLCLINEFIPGDIGYFARDHSLDLLTPAVGVFFSKVFFALALLVFGHFLESTESVCGWVH